MPWWRHVCAWAVLAKANGATNSARCEGPPHCTDNPANTAPLLLSAQPHTACSALVTSQLITPYLPPNNGSPPTVTYSIYPLPTTYSVPTTYSSTHAPFIHAATQ